MSDINFPKIIISWGDAEDDMPPYYMVALYPNCGDDTPDFITVDVADEHVVFDPENTIDELCAEENIDPAGVTVVWDL